MAFANHPADQPPNRDIDHAGLQQPRETLYPRSLSIRVVAFSRGQIRSPFDAANQICKRLFRERRLQRVGSSGLSSTLFNTHLGARRYFPRFFNESSRHRFPINQSFDSTSKFSNPAQTFAEWIVDMVARGVSRGERRAVEGWAECYEEWTVDMVAGKESRGERRAAEGFGF
jgi:hypothetical protein